METVDYIIITNLTKSINCTLRNGNLFFGFKVLSLGWVLIVPCGMETKIAEYRKQLDVLY